MRHYNRPHRLFRSAFAERRLIYDKNAPKNQPDEIPAVAAQKPDVEKRNAMDDLISRLKNIDEQKTSEIRSALEEVLKDGDISVKEADILSKDIFFKLSSEVDGEAEERLKEVLPKNHKEMIGLLVDEVRLITGMEYGELIKNARPEQDAQSQSAKQESAQGDNEYSSMSNEDIVQKFLQTKKKFLAIKQQRHNLRSLYNRSKGMRRGMQKNEYLQEMRYLNAAPETKAMKELNNVYHSRNGIYITDPDSPSGRAGGIPMDLEGAKQRRYLREARKNRKKFARHMDKDRIGGIKALHSWHKNQGMERQKYKRAAMRAEYGVSDRAGITETDARFGSHIDSADRRGRVVHRHGNNYAYNDNPNLPRNRFGYNERGEGGYTDHQSQYRSLMATSGGREAARYVLNGDKESREQEKLRHNYSKQMNPDMLEKQFAQIIKEDPKAKKLIDTLRRSEAVTGEDYSGRLLVKRSLEAMDKQYKQQKKDTVKSVPKEEATPKQSPERKNTVQSKGEPQSKEIPKKPAQSQWKLRKDLKELRERSDKHYAKNIKKIMTEPPLGYSIQADTFKVLSKEDTKVIDGFPIKGHIVEFKTNSGMKVWIRMIYQVNDSGEAKINLEEIFVFDSDESKKFTVYSNTYNLNVHRDVMPFGLYMFKDDFNDELAKVIGAIENRSASSQNKEVSQTTEENNESNPDGPELKIREDMIKEEPLVAEKPIPLVAKKPDLNASELKKRPASSSSKSLDDVANIIKDYDEKMSDSIDVQKIDKNLSDLISAIQTKINGTDPFALNTLTVTTTEYTEPDRKTLIIGPGKSGKKLEMYYEKKGDKYVVSGYFLTDKSDRIEDEGMHYSFQEITPDLVNSLVSKYGLKEKANEKPVEAQKPKNNETQSTTPKFSEVFSEADAQSFKKNLEKEYGWDVDVRIDGTTVLVTRKVGSKEMTTKFISRYVDHTKEKKFRKSGWKFKIEFSDKTTASPNNPVSSENMEFEIKRHLNRFEQWNGAPLQDLILDDQKRKALKVELKKLPPKEFMEFYTMLVPTVTIKNSKAEHILVNEGDWYTTNMPKVQIILRQLLKSKNVDTRKQLAHKANELLPQSVRSSFVRSAPKMATNAQYPENELLFKLDIAAHLHLILEKTQQSGEISRDSEGNEKQNIAPKPSETFSETDAQSLKQALKKKYGWNNIEVTKAADSITVKRTVTDGSKKELKFDMSKAGKNVLQKIEEYIFNNKDRLQTPEEIADDLINNLE